MCCTSYYNIPSSLPEGASGCSRFAFWRMIVKTVLKNMAHMVDLFFGARNGTETPLCADERVDRASMEAQS